MVVVAKSRFSEQRLPLFAIYRMMARKYEENISLQLVPTIQGGITCGAIDEPRKSSKAIDERVIINFRDKNGVIARFRDKNVVIVRFCDKNVECLYIYYGVIEE